VAHYKDALASLPGELAKLTAMQSSMKATDGEGSQLYNSTRSDPAYENSSKDKVGNEVSDVSRDYLLPTAGCKTQHLNG
jgi:hypothetical protein